MDVYKLKSYGCHTCPVRCGALIQIDEGPYATDGEVHRPEYETLAALGPQLPQRPGRGRHQGATRSATATASTPWGWAALSPSPSSATRTASSTRATPGAWSSPGGTPRPWWNSSRQIGAREGFGALLADGAKYAAEKIGKGSEQYAMTVAGRAIPFHDPRLSPAHGTHYIADAQPANHMGPAPMSALEGGTALGSDPLLQTDTGTDVRRLGQEGRSLHAGRGLLPAAQLGRSLRPLRAVLRAAGGRTPRPGDGLGHRLGGGS